MQFKGYRFEVFEFFFRNLMSNLVHYSTKPALCLSYWLSPEIPFLHQVSVLRISPAP